MFLTSTLSTYLTNCTLLLICTTGYTVVKNNHGEVVYAQVNGDGDLTPSNTRVGKMPKGEKKNKQKGIRPSKDVKNKKCNSKKGKTLFSCYKGDSKSENSLHHRRTSLLRGHNNNREDDIRSLSQVPSSHGTLKNLVVLMQWSDHLNVTGLPTPDELDILMNHDGPHTLCPTGSIRDVYLQNSYGALSLESTVVAWVPMDNTQAYYCNGQEG